MPYLAIDKENSADIKLYYEDHGLGKPVVLIHGYPQSSAAWEKQVGPLLEAGHRVVAYDRRGFGKSCQPATGYDYDTFAADLHALMSGLDLHDVTLVGHSMGSGEICRYLRTFGSDRVSKVVFLAPMQPWLLKSDANPDGIDVSVIEGFKKAVLEDRFAFLKTFFSNFYSSGILDRNGVSDQAFQHSITVGAFASAKACHDCIETWITDFRSDLPAVTVPSLILHGTSDHILPFKATAQRMQKLLPNCRLVQIDGAPHALLWTHADVVNQEILTFLAAGAFERSVA